MLREVWVNGFRRTPSYRVWPRRTTTAPRSRWRRGRGLSTPCRRGAGCLLPHAADRAGGPGAHGRRDRAARRCEGVALSKAGRRRSGRGRDHRLGAGVDVSVLLSAAFGLGIALGASPGPVQLPPLFSEASRGGASRGLRAMVGANATFGAMLLLLAAGLSASARRVVPAGRAGGRRRLPTVPRGRRRPGEPATAGRDETRPRGYPSVVRGVVAVILNPGVYVFLATTGAAVLASATEGGRAPRSRRRPRSSSACR